MLTRLATAINSKYSPCFTRCLGTTARVLFVNIRHDALISFLRLVRKLQTQKVTQHRRSCGIVMMQFKHALSLWLKIDILTFSEEDSLTGLFSTEASAGRSAGDARFEPDTSASIWSWNTTWDNTGKHDFLPYILYLYAYFYLCIWKLRPNANMLL